MPQDLTSCSDNTVIFGNTTLRDENELLRYRIAALEFDKSVQNDEIMPTQTYSEVS